MSEIHAAMGLSNLPHVAEIIRQNYANYCQYEKLLAPIRGISLACRKVRETSASNYQYIVCHVDRAECGFTADELAHEVRVRHFLVL